MPATLKWLEAWEPLNNSGEGFVNELRKELASRHVLSQDPLAYEKLVDRLLDSPHYGERWGRHWLDVVRFAETGVRLACRINARRMPIGADVDYRIDRGVKRPGRRDG